MDKLLIIESPNKIKTLSKYLGKGFEIFATIGHIRDLSQFGMGFDSDFEPKWVIPSLKKKSNTSKKIVETNKKEIVDKLKKEAHKVKEIYIATDPDREGEAIAWHVYDILDEKDKSKCKRITFNEISESAILESFNHKREIDINWVHSQFARRIIDRLIGFRLSKLLKAKLDADSAGRVQSVALKFIEDREKEIAAFVSEKWWTIETMLKNKVSLTLKKINPEFKDINVCDKKFSASGIDLKDATSANNLLKLLDKNFIVSAIEASTFYTINPKPCYKTSTLQQDAINKLGWNTKKTTLIAQHLYEGVDVGGNQIALISYPRTDSVRLSPTFKATAFEFIEKTFSKEYVGKYDDSNSKKANVQDAHEAIRPIDPYLTPEKVKDKISKDEYALYKLIYKRTIAALMSPAKFKRTNIKFTNNGCEFYAASKECIFLGFKKLMNEENDEEDVFINLDDFKVDKAFEAQKIEAKEHDTLPPQRYTQATLIADLEKAGVGRPSTYSSMANIALERGYANLEKKCYIMNEIGKMVVNKLEEFFPDVINKDFTKQMEEHLDEIANGNEQWKDWLKEFSPKFDEDIKKAYNEMEKIADQKVGRNCPQCQKGELIIKKARKTGSKFIGCDSYPDCKYLEPLNKPEILSQICPECSSQLIKRKSKRQQSFIGCSSYPKCNYILSEKVFNNFIKNNPEAPLPKKEKLELDAKKKEMS
ncbi:MAG: type I DNA topoisomerase [Malacoplasma sp.]|nr:type I DNA topoisomerase [Malacoplasma sp.]